jgi:hypothetical protein
MRPAGGFQSEDLGRASRIKFGEGKRTVLAWRDVRRFAFAVLLMAFDGG